MESPKPVEPAVGDAAPSPSDRLLRVAEDDAGGRLDAFLARELALSRRQVRRLLAGEQVELLEEGGQSRPLGSAAKGLLLDAGLQVAVRDFRRPEDERAKPAPELEVPILASGEGWLAVDKPAGAPVHPLGADEGGTVLGALAASHPGFAQRVHGVGEGGLRSGVVHRLDVDTSGVLLVASEEEAWRRLREAFSSHRVAKRYRALVAGALEGEARLVRPLVVASHSPARVRVCSPDTRGAVETRQSVRPIGVLASGRATLVEVDLETGFLHQIRAVLASEGHPVLGDAIYSAGSGGDPGLAAPRQMLHCERVAVDEIDACSPDPADFLECLVRLREGSAE